jgi:hypothetical protein
MFNSEHITRASIQLLKPEQSRSAFRSALPSGSIREESEALPTDRLPTGSNLNMSDIDQTRCEGCFYSHLIGFQLGNPGKFSAAREPTTKMPAHAG